MDDLNDTNQNNAVPPLPPLPSRAKKTKTIFDDIADTKSFSISQAEVLFTV